MADKLDLDVAKWLSQKSSEQDVLIKDIGINSYQVRYSNVEEKIEELEEMLEVAGTNFHPVLICKASEELPFKYDIIYGQRRLTAATNLGWEKIKANIIDAEVPVVIGQAISLMENEGRVPTSASDISDTIKALHLDYGLGRKEIKERLGIPLRIVQEVLWAEELLPEVEQVSKDLKIKPKIALDIQRRCTVDNVIDDKKTIEILEDISKFDDTLRRSVVKVLNDDKSLKHEDAIKHARATMSATEIKVVFLKNEYQALSSAAGEAELNDQEYIHASVIDKLNTDNYL